MRMMGKVFLDLGDTKKIKDKYIKRAILYFKRSFALAFKTNLKLELAASLDELISIYEKIGKDKEKQKYLKLKLKNIKGTGTKI